MPIQGLSREDNARFAKLKTKHQASMARAERFLAKSPGSAYEQKKAITALNRTVQQVRDLAERGGLEKRKRGSADPLTNLSVDRGEREIATLRRQVRNMNGDRLTGGAQREERDERRGSVRGEARGGFSHHRRGDEWRNFSGSRFQNAAYRRGFEAFCRSGDRSGIRGAARIRNEMQSQDNPNGGVLVPFEMETQIAELMGDFSVMRQISTVRPITTGSLKIPHNLRGVTSGWVGEKEARPETETDELSLLEFHAMELYAEPKTTTVLVEDANVNIEQFVNDGVSREFAEQEGDAYINGNGIKKPRGFLMYDTVANLNWSWGKVGYIPTGAAADFASDDPADALIDLQRGLRRGYRNAALWLMNDLTAARISKFKNGDGEYIWREPTLGDHPPMLFGKAVEIDDFMPDIGAGAFPIAFGDFMRSYIIVDRVGTTMMRDDITEKGFVKFYTRKRVGGGVKDFESFKLLKIAAS